MIQDSPKVFQDGPKMAQEGCRMAQNGSKMGQDGPEMAPGFVSTVDADMFIRVIVFSNDHKDDVITAKFRALQECPPMLNFPAACIGSQKRR